MTQYTPVLEETTLSEEVLHEELLPQLRDNVFHVTAYARFEKIITSRSVLANRDGSLGYTYPQSDVNVGRKKGWVSLFDLRDTSDESISWGLRCLYFLAPPPLGDDLVFLFVRPERYADLIGQNEVKAAEGVGAFCIPHIECWYPSDMPLDAIGKVLRVHVRRRKVDPNSPGAMHLAALRQSRPDSPPPSV